MLHLPRRHGLRPRHEGAVHRTRPSPPTTRARARREPTTATTRSARRCRSRTPWPRTTSSAASPTGTPSARTATTRTTPRRRRPTQLTDGWTVSGRQAAISGVAVANGAAGAAPAYTFLDGTAGSSRPRVPDLLQVPLRVHDARTRTTASRRRRRARQGDRAQPRPTPRTTRSRPPGKNATAQMAWSLANTSPYKQWNFTIGSTVRCVNCHGDPREVRRDASQRGATGGRDLGAAHEPVPRDPHPELPRPRPEGPAARCTTPPTSPSATSATPRQPFVSSNSHQHGVRRPRPPRVGHRRRRARAALTSTPPGQGGGNALCAECHFRTHGTAQAYNAGDRSNPRLVNFAPNVQPFPDASGVIRFTKTATGGSCTLVCHGKAHDAEGY